ncbi:hypothetical protein D3C78_1735400 [compost metagenome]
MRLSSRSRLGNNISAKEIERGNHIYMAAYMAKAPAGFMELHKALLARGPVSTAEREMMAAEHAEKQRLDREVARITAEMDSGEYFADIEKHKAYLRQMAKIRIG